MITNREIIKLLFNNIKRYFPNLIFILLLDLLSTPIALLMPIPLMLVVDSYFGSNDVPELIKIFVPEFIITNNQYLLLFIVVMIIVIACVSQLRKLVSQLLKTLTGEKITLDFRSHLLNHAQNLSLNFHDTKGTNDSLYRIQYDAEAVQNVSIYGLTPFISAVLTIFGMIYVTFQMDEKLAIIALSICPILLFSTNISRKKLKKRWRVVKRIESSALSIVQEILSSLRIIKTFGQENIENDRFKSCSYEGVKARIHILKYESILDLFNTLTISFGTALVLYIGAKHVQSNILTLGQLLLIMSYLGQLYSPLSQIVKQVAIFQNGLTSLERCFSLLNERQEILDKTTSIPIGHARGEIEFQNVSFSYDGVKNVINNISFYIPEGSKVGITGKTGSGKTTLINLILRLYNTSSGSILLDGINIDDIKISLYRQQFMVVLQDSILLTCSIYENIAFAKPNSTSNEIINAAKMANAHHFITKLPEGYDSLIGEKGMKLSGGERQRISLARAFLKNSPILILDEATSAVDNETEEDILEATHRLMYGKTIIIISHKPKTLENCDLLLKFENGRLTSNTPHNSKC